MATALCHCTRVYCTALPLGHPMYKLNINKFLQEDITSDFFGH